MKKLLALLAIGVIAISSAMARDRVTRDVNVLPQKALAFIKENFSVKNVSHIKIDDKTFGGADYDVIFTDGTEIEFNSDGDWEEVDVGRGAVKPVFVLNEIASYVAKNYKGQNIVSVKKDRNKYEIELSSGLDLEFDRAGRFLRIDD